MKSIFLRYAGGWEDARQKLKNIVALAYDSLHAELKARFLVDRANAGEFGVRFHEYDSAQTSTMYAATHARGGLNSLLWGSAIGLHPGHRSSPERGDSHGGHSQRQEWPSCLWYFRHSGLALNVLED